MKILVLGAGGREHALCWKLSSEAEVHCAPGNPGIAAIATCHPVEITNFEAVDQLAQSLSADLIVVGPEAPLISGLADHLRACGLAVFGPNQDGAKLEGSKAFSKDVMRAAGVPTARYLNTSNPAEAITFATDLFESGVGAVIKASGPALGKGVIVCYSIEEANDAIESIMIDREFGDSGTKVVVEERIDGREFSLLTLCNESGYLSLPVAQDYKRAFDNDRGPNTGGMGTYSPVPWVSKELVKETEVKVVAPLLAELQRRGITYRGVLFSGLMVRENTPLCLEYNVRFGDPETQTVMKRLGMGFAQALLDTATGRPISPIETLDNGVVTVVIASEGYPGDIQKGKTIKITEPSANTTVFHAGTAEHDGLLITNGGRVFAISSTGETLVEAREAAYRDLLSISFEGMRYRTDIARI